jgi:hypothetical protein
MQSKKLSSRPVSVLVSRTLKIVGIVVILAALIDIFILPMPYQITDRQWQINFVAGVVDRGIVPLIGVVLFLTGFWVDSNADTVSDRKKLWQDPRFWALVFSSVLGLIFLLLFPLHLNNVRLGHQEAVQQVNQQIADAEKQLNGQLQTEVDSRRQQINQLVSATDDQIKQLVQGGQLTQNQADLIRKFKADPKSVEPFLKQQEEELRTKVQTEVGIRREEAQKTTTTEALKSGLRVGLSSLLLAIGYIVVGWTGLRNLRQM